MSCECIRFSKTILYVNQIYNKQVIGKAFTAVMKKMFHDEEPSFETSIEKCAYRDILSCCQAEQIIGDRYHWNWKGGITPENVRQRNSVEYSEWRKAVFKRDNYTCCICHKVGGRLNAHHIKHWATNPELRFDVNNGITLCSECHKEIHRKKK